MKTIAKLLVILLITNACIKDIDLNINNLKCESKVNPLGIDIAQPRLSWNLESKNRGVKQAAYQILVSSSKEKLDKNDGDMWDSKRIVSDRSIQMTYGGKTLQSNHKYFWKVKIWAQNTQIFQSEPAYFLTGLFKEKDWQAKWIGLDKAVGSDDTEAAHRILSARNLRKEFTIEKKVSSATAFISGLGLFEFYINGKKIGDQVLAPALTEYNKRSFYMTFDVTNNINAKENALGILLGNGRFFAPRSTVPTLTKTYGYPKAICQINILFEDGSTEIIKTDDTWKLTTDGPIRKNNEFDGEFYDATKEMLGWNNIGFNDAKWMPATLVSKPGTLLVSQPIEPIKIMEVLTPISVKEVKPDVFIFDMGQNMVGWTELFVKGNTGDKVTLRFAETINEDGTLFLDNIRSAEVTDTYILKGKEKESWEPKFTYHGFRYVEMKGFPGKPDVNAIKGKVIHDDLELTGSFESSNPLINNIYKNAYWGIRGNYRSIPTDCPQRDERQGWLGDRSAECTGESYVFDISKLYGKWIVDIKDAQLESGSIPDVAPSYWPIYSDNTTWPGTYLFASDMLYTQYGDLKTIKTNYPYMQKWVDYMSKFLKNGIMPKDTYGDWCVPPEDLKLIHTSDPLRITSSEVIGTAYFYYELKLMAKFAELLGKKEDVSNYTKISQEIKKAFNDKFLDKRELRYSNNTHTVNILAIVFDIVPEEFKDIIIENLLQKILAESDGHVGNGIVGGQWLMRTLTNTGHADVAYMLASQNTYPSWGYMVEKGATTIWELWNGDEGDPGMNSGNHVMLLGDLIIWFYENLAGIKADPSQPAFKHIIMKPQVLGDLTYIKASYNSSYGKIESNWKVNKDNFQWHITIPANTSATIYVPTLNKEDVLEGNEIAKDKDHIKFIRYEGNDAVLKIESGTYSFSSNGTIKNKTEDYVSTPIIRTVRKELFVGDQIEVEITNDDKDAVVRYTINNQNINEESPIYKKPLKIVSNTTLRIQAFKEGKKPSMQIKEAFNFVNPVNNGVKWTLYRGRYNILPDFNKLKYASKGKIYQMDLNKLSTPKNDFALQLESYILIENDDNYEFFTVSNDGSKLYINNELVVSNDGEHGPRELSGSVFLTKGRHLIRVEYFQSGGSKTLRVKYKSKNISYQDIPGSVLFLKND